MEGGEGGKEGRICFSSSLISCLKKAEAAHHFLGRELSLVCEEKEGNNSDLISFKISFA